MGFFERFKDIIGANVNDILDKAEDPVKTAKYEVVRFMEALAECKKDTEMIMAQESARKRELDEAQAKVDKYTAMAKKALLAGQEADAKKCLAKKQEYDALLAQAQSRYDMAHANSVRMQETYRDLAGKVDTLKARAEGVQAAAATAKAQEQMAALMDKYGAGSTGIDKLTRAEQKVNARLDAAQASVALGSTGSEEAELEAKYGISGSSSSVDAEMARMKAELGL